MSDIPDAKGDVTVNGLTQEMISKLGPVLHKAIGDPYSYFCRLRTGERISFSEADFLPQYPDHITLEVTSMEPPPKDGSVAINLERGLCVRIEDIEWCVDFEH